nr:aminoacyl-histidine dipeptidase [uncultured Sellimonas sp.]
MAVLEQLEPKKVFQIFEELSSVPRGTFYDEKISNWCVEFAKQRNLEYIQDEAGNVIIKKPGTPGYENSEPVIIQGHMDMVCEKVEGSEHDFEKDPLDLYIEDGYIKARGTTLGGDDGIAMAYGLAILDSDDIPHPPIEVVITVDEEIGMGGANAIDMANVKGNILLNIDGEVEGTILAGCAGGVLETLKISVDREEQSGCVADITIKGLRGGHSGSQIHEQRGNANKIMARILNRLNQETDIYLVSVNGGTKDNVIAATATAKIVAKDAAKAEKIVTELTEVLKNEFGKDEPDLEIRFAGAEGTECACTKEATDRVIFGLLATPYGVQGLSRDLPGVVETSLNLGIVKSETDQICLMYYLRSSVNSQMEELKAIFRTWAKMLKAEHEESGEYPAWMYERDSKIRPLMAETYKELTGKDPIISTVHAGLECGLLSAKKPGLDCVSFGPDIPDVHSVKERLNIESTARTWELIKAVLAKLK